MRVDNKFPIFKGNGAARWTMSPPTYRTVDLKSGGFLYTPESNDKGAVFMEVAPNTGKPREYDGAGKKINMKLGVTDLSMWLDFVRRGVGSELKLFHDPNKGREGEGKTSKVGQLQAPSSSSNWLLNVSETTEGKTNKVMVPIAPHEMMTLIILFEQAVRVTLGWAAYPAPSNQERSDHAKYKYDTSTSGDLG